MLAILSLIIGCTKTGSVPASPIDVEINLEKAPILRETTNINAKLMIRETFRDITFEDTIFNLQLPDGFELIDGDLSWEGDLSKNKPVVLNAKIKAVKVGDYEIKASARSPKTGDTWYGDTDYVYVRIGEDKSSISNYPFKKS